MPIKLDELKIGYYRYKIVSGMSAADFTKALQDSVDTETPFDTIIDKRMLDDGSLKIDGVLRAISSEIDDEGYPSDETLREIETWEFDLDGRECFAQFMSFVEGAWNMDYGLINKDGRKMTLVTGGWSGNEDVLNAMMNNYIFWAINWVMSERGGRFTFEIRG